MVTRRRKTWETIGLKERIERYRHRQRGLEPHYCIGVQKVNNGSII